MIYIYIDRKTRLSVTPGHHKCMCVFLSHLQCMLCAREHDISKYDIFYNLIMFCRNQSSQPGRPCQSLQGRKFEVKSLENMLGFVILSLSLCIYVYTQKHAQRCAQVLFMHRNVWTIWQSFFPQIARCNTAFH